MAWAQVTSPVTWVGAAGYETIVKAVATIGIIPCTLVVPEGTQQVSSDLTIPSNITLKVLNGANIQIALDSRLRIQGPFIAGSYKVFTDNSGDLGKGVKFSQTCGLSFVQPEWWGAVGDNTVDCTLAINALLTLGTFWRRDNTFAFPCSLALGLIYAIARLTLLTAQPFEACPEVAVSCGITLYLPSLTGRNTP